MICSVRRLTFAPKDLIDKDWSERQEDYISLEWKPKRGLDLLVFSTPNVERKRFWPWDAFKLVRKLRAREEAELRAFHECKNFSEQPFREGVTLTSTENRVALRAKWDVVFGT